MARRARSRDEPISTSTAPDRARTAEVGDLSWTRSPRPVASVSANPPAPSVNRSSAPSPAPLRAALLTARACSDMRLTGIVADVTETAVSATARSNMPDPSLAIHSATVKRSSTSGLAPRRATSASRRRYPGASGAPVRPATCHSTGAGPWSPQPTSDRRSPAPTSSASARRCVLARSTASPPASHRPPAPDGLHTRPPTLAPASTTTTSAPETASRRAAVRPEIPAPTTTASCIAERLDLVGGEGAPLPGREAPGRDPGVRRPVQMDHRMPDRGAHPPHLAVSALVDGDVDDARPAASDVGGRRRPVVELDARPQALKHVVAGVTLHARTIRLGDAVARVHQPVGEAAVVREQEDAGGVAIEAADGKQARAGLDEARHGRPALRVMSRRHDAARL